mmetsp:Transcript_12523/g.25316  ORF Transcript_12523/g.25316 Transcript_12523/m.25316 type:complete len:482 (-) Transcript_12523:90-1535(-)|eukprot:scaffold15669_cov160-Amphora_coffeaeformis.AAC.3
MPSSDSNISTSFEQERRAESEEEAISYGKRSSSFVLGIVCIVFSSYILSNSFRDPTTGHLKSEPWIANNGGKGVTTTPSADPITTTTTTTPPATTTTTTTTAQAIPTTSTTPATTTTSTTVSAFESNTNPETGFPPLTSEDDWVTIQKTCAKGHAGCAVYVMEKSGMGSALLGVFKHRIMHRVFGRPYFIVDESRYPYYRSPDWSKGVLTTFFTPTFPIIDDPTPFHYIDEILPKGQSMNGMIVKSPKKSKYWDTYTEVSSIITLRRPDTRNEMSDYFLNGNFSEEDLWRMLVEEMCPDLRYNDETQKKVDAVIAEHGFPNLLALETTSVTFHVRRTDKVDQHESIPYTGESYVAQLLEAQPDANPAHCYVATDDASVVQEIITALRQYGLTCQVWDLPDDNKAGGKEGKYIRSTYDESLIFLAELSMMVEATYFVGTWDSNVGILATVLRGCPPYGRQDIPMAHSYHVDDNLFLHSNFVG